MEFEYTLFNLTAKCKPDYGVSGPLIVPQNAITVSSMADPRHNGNAARINTVDVNVVPGGWEALTDDSNQWIKVDLGKVYCLALFSQFKDRDIKYIT